MAPPVNNLAGLQLPDSVRRTRHFAQRLSGSVLTPVRALPIGGAGLAALAFAEARLSGDGGIGLRAWEFFERLIRRQGRGLGYDRSPRDLRLVRRHPFVSRFSPPFGSRPPKSSVEAFPHRAAFIPLSISPITYRTIYSFITQTLLFRQPLLDKDHPVSPARYGRAVHTLPPPMGTAFVTPRAAAWLSREQERLRHTPPDFVPRLARRFEEAAAKSRPRPDAETRSWRGRVPFMDSAPLSRPPVPQASWLGVSPSAPPPAERRPALSSTSAKKRRITQPLMADRPSITRLLNPEMFPVSPLSVLWPLALLPRLSFRTLPEMIYGSRAFLPRPVSRLPPDEGPSSSQVPLASAPFSADSSISGLSENALEQTSGARPSFFKAATRLLAAAAALSFVQTLPALRPVAASSVSWPTSPSASRASLILSERSLVRIGGRRNPVFSPDYPIDTSPRFYSIKPSPQQPHLSTIVPEFLSVSRRTPLLLPHHGFASWHGTVSESEHEAGGLPFLSPAVQVPKPRVFGSSFPQAESESHEQIRLSFTPLSFFSRLRQGHSRPDRFASPRTVVSTRFAEPVDSPASLPFAGRAFVRSKIAMPGQDFETPVEATTPISSSRSLLSVMLTRFGRHRPASAASPSRIMPGRVAEADAFAPYDSNRYSLSRVLETNRIGPVSPVQEIGEWFEPRPAPVSFLSRFRRSRSLTDRSIPEPERLLPSRGHTKAERSSALTVIGHLTPGLLPDLIANHVLVLPSLLIHPVPERETIALFSETSPRLRTSRAENLGSADGAPSRPWPLIPLSQNSVRDQRADFSLMVEEAVVTEFQPQLLTLVSSFLRDWWKYVTDAEETPELGRVPFTSLTPGAAHWPAVGAPHFSSPSLLTSRTEQGLAARGPVSPLLLGAAFDERLASMRPKSPALRLVRVPEMSQPEEIFPNLASVSLNRSLFVLRPLSAEAANPAASAPARRSSFAPAAERVDSTFTVRHVFPERPIDVPARVPPLLPLTDWLPVVMAVVDGKRAAAISRGFADTRTARAVPRPAAFLPPRPVPMVLPIPAPSISPEETWAIQRVASGSQSASPTTDDAHQQDVNLASQEKGAAANDVHLLANEVWSLLKRRLETEAERIGRR